MPTTDNWNDTILADFRAHDGQITEGRLKGASLLLMTTTGAKTGRPRTAFVGYHLDRGRYIVVGSNQGRDAHPAWLENVRKNPIVTVEVGTEKFQARATITEGAERRRLLDDRIAAVPQFGVYETMTKRALPVIALERLAKPGHTAG
ncbi:MAG: nitroreductase/quinone reductase family protein [Candidatus Limnocylindrales bacterium]|jgi:deazaflavin-dependent oxidoreductase (nitroreductase family)